MAQSDQQAAFLRIMEQYRQPVWRLVNSYETEPSRREDLFQEIALGLWQAIPRFRGDSSERTWLYRIAHNIAISTMESRRKREHREFPITESFSSPSVADHPDRTLLLEEKRQAMLAAMRELAAIDKQLIVLHLEGLSYEEIEQISGLSQSAIGSRLSRIRDRLTATIRGKEIRG
ncbi:MAG TPA: RNA polymerase sigma factor [Bryobacteraceae bacterium]|nr:RNA polymerase sigma factor [Bryobacteraceae bacterium]